MKEQATLDYEAGASLKQHGQDMTAWSNLQFVETMRESARLICKSHGSVTIDDLRMKAEKYNVYPLSPNAWGAIFHEKGWRLIDHVQSQVKTNRARWIGRWRWEP